MVLAAVFSEGRLRRGFEVIISWGTSTRVVEAMLSWRLWFFSVVCFLCCSEGGGQGRGIAYCTSSLMYQIAELGSCLL